MLSFVNVISNTLPFAQFYPLFQSHSKFELYPQSTLTIEHSVVSQHIVRDFTVQTVKGTLVSRLRNSATLYIKGLVGQTFWTDFERMKLFAFLLLTAQGMDGKWQIFDFLSHERLFSLVKNFSCNVLFTETPNKGLWNEGQSHLFDHKSKIANTVGTQGKGTPNKGTPNKGKFPYLTWHRKNGK